MACEVYFSKAKQIRLKIKSRPCLAPGGFQPKPYHN